MHRISAGIVILVAMSILIPKGRNRVMGNEAQPVGKASQTIGFRVDAKIYADQQSEPFDETVILFDSGVAYDLPQLETRFATVIDPARQRIILLDQLTQVRATITVDDLIRKSARVRAAAQAAAREEQIGLLATVKKDGDGQYSIGYGNVVYEVTTQAAGSPTAIKDYGRFVDLSARLNIARQLGPPPFARMTLNDALTAGQKLPQRLTRTIRDSQQQVVQVFRQDHEVTAGLSDSDRETIVKLRNLMELYREVPLKQFPN